VLQEFGFRNFFSFKDGVSISLKLDANCSSYIATSSGFATVIGIKGANASGKTQLLKAFTFLADFCSKSFASDPKESLLFSPFFDSKEPSEFYVDFSVSDVIYRYELVCTESAVVSEIIYQKKIKTIKIFERKGNEIVFTTKKFAPLKLMKLRNNASIISTANQYQLTELKQAYDFFSHVFTNVGYGGLRENKVDIKTVSKYLHGNSDALNFVSKFIAECDTGIDAIKIQKTKREAGGDEFFPIFSHKNERSVHAVTQVTESSGTKALYRDLPMYRIVLKNGGVMVIDEFDIHLHPHILPKLLGLFLDPESNPRNAQLIFSTHDSKVLDFLGRYRVYLVNKRENESFAFRLDEIPGDILRNDRSILPAYDDGKIGGVPRI